jgi:electron transfer flavoprotein alpha subunit
MASIVAYIELREGAITSPSRFVVAEARRIADAAGATVFALLTVGPLAQVEMDSLASEISAAGADRILCSSADTLGRPALDVTHGGLLAQVAAHLRPLLFLFPAGGTGAQLGPPLAVRMGAAYMANATVDICAEDRGTDPASQRVLLSRWRPARDRQRKIDVGDLERSVVASLVSGPSPTPAGKPYAEVEMVPCPDAQFPDAHVSDSEVDPAAELDVCRALVWAGRPTATAADAFRAVLPDGVSLATDHPESLGMTAAAPQDIFVLPSAQGLPVPALGAVITHVGSVTNADTETTESTREAETADADLAEFAAALARAQSQGGMP